MVYLLIKKASEDIVSWKNAFEKFFEYRRIGGELSCEFYQTGSGTHDLIILSQWESVDRLNEFLQSQSFEMIKNLEIDLPLQFQLLNKESYGRLIKELN
jgi:heme-degrading monooxygenase HmoA